jgi:hypothetical protein
MMRSIILFPQCFFLRTENISLSLRNCSHLREEKRREEKRKEEKRSGCKSLTQFKCFCAASICSCASIDKEIETHGTAKDSEFVIIVGMKI